MLQTGTHLHDRYRVLRRIGRGGMGAVYEAVDTRLRNTVAVKQLELAGAAADRAFEREAQLLAGFGIRPCRSSSITSWRRRMRSSSCNTSRVKTSRIISRDCGSRWSQTRSSRGAAPSSAVSPTSTRISRQSFIATSSRPNVETDTDRQRRLAGFRARERTSGRRRDGLIRVQQHVRLHAAIRAARADRRARHRRAQRFVCAGRDALSPRNRRATSERPAPVAGRQKRHAGSARSGR